MKKKIITLLLLSLFVTSISGCGEDTSEFGESSIGEWTGNTESSEEWSSDSYEEYEEADLSGEEEISLSDVLLTDFPTENTVPDYDDSNAERTEIVLDAFCDYTVKDYLAENGTEEYEEDLLWLADTVVNKIEPQAVETLLQVPAFREGVENGLISKYTTLYLTRNENNLYAAMTIPCVLNENLEAPSDDDSDVIVQNMGFQLLVNTAEFTGREDFDDQKLRELEGTMIHELTHAFMADLTRNAFSGTDKYGNELFLKNPDGSDYTDENGNFQRTNALPPWLLEGMAETTEAGFYARQGDLQIFFGGEETATEDLLATLMDPVGAAEYLDEINEMGAEDGIALTDVTLEENTYSIGYTAAMYLYAMAAETMDLTVFSDDGSLKSDALLSGMDMILTALVDGSSMDEIVAAISTDEATGVPVYADLADFEQNYLHSGDPGVEFLRKMLLDYGRRSLDPSVSIASGSVLPGFINAAEHYMDDKYHSPAPVFQIVNEPNPEYYGDYYAVSTVRPSDLSLGGGRTLSYDPETDALTPEEEEARDIAYIGDELIIINYDS